MIPFDPSRLDPKALAELSALVRELPPEKVHQMQSLMHNAMAGFDTKAGMEEFERSLPPGFREKMLGICLRSMGENAAVAAPEPEATSTDLPGSVRDARLTVLRAVAGGSVGPDEAYGLLFTD